MKQKPPVDFSYQDYLAWTYFDDNAFDRSEFERFDALLNGVTRFFDVGASHGVYTFHANKILKNAEIFAVEADPERFRILSENVKLWSAESNNTIHCIHAAASDEDDRRQCPHATFFTTGTQISGGLFSVSERSDRYAPITVPIICLDDYFEPEAKAFIKIDVEGAELRVLKGAKRHIQSGNTQLFTEITKWGDRGRGASAVDVLRFCLASGLRLDRRLRSDYLLSPESNRASQIWSVMKCLPPLLLRVIYAKVTPIGLRTWIERRINRRRLSRYDQRVD